MKANSRIFEICKKMKADVAVMAVVILWIYGSIRYGSMFYSFSNNLRNVLRTASLMGIMAIGVNLCFLIGARDLSVSAIAALTSMVTAYFCKYNLMSGIFMGLLTGVFMGAVNGFVVGKFNVQPFIATLGTQLAARGVALLLNNEYSIGLTDNGELLKIIGNQNLGGILPYPILIFITLIVLFAVVLRFTSFGRAIYAVGGNEESAEMMGIRVWRIKFFVFLISSVLSAISGILLTGRLNAGQPTACEGWEMTIMAAVVIGGTSVKGGEGNVTGIFMGVVFVQLISNLINLNGNISAYWKDIATGVILLLAVLSQVFMEYYKKRIRVA